MVSQKFTAYGDSKHSIPLLLLGSSVLIGETCLWKAN